MRWKSSVTIVGRCSPSAELPKNSSREVDLDDDEKRQLRKLRGRLHTREHAANAVSWSARSGIPAPCDFQGTRAATAAHNQLLSA